MSNINYLDFELLIQRVDDEYRAHVVKSPAGEAAIRFKVPFDDLELENFLLRIGRRRAGTRGIESSEMELAKSFGGRLFAAVFDKEVQDCLRGSLNTAGLESKGLRIRLRLTDVPELADLPWEYLYNPAPLNRFLALSVETPLVRYLEMPERLRSLPVTLPLRILVMISSPTDYPGLDVELEWSKLCEALGDLQGDGLVELKRLDKATLIALQRELRSGGEYHIFHFIGHGGFDQGAGVLLLEDQRGRGSKTPGERLGIILRDCRTLRLAVLNACEGARAGRTDSFSGMAQSLIQAGIPAVIAMQFEITDEAAVLLAHEFYRALADGNSLDTSLSEARKAMYAQDNGLEWGTPVLYLRAPDGRIFDVNARARGARAYITKRKAAALLDRAAKHDSGASQQIAIETKLVQPLPTKTVGGSFGTLDVKDPLYIARVSDSIALDAITQHPHGVTITIKGPRQVGKSSLLMQMIAAATKTGKRTVFLDFQSIGESTIANADNFFAQFCAWLTAELGQEDKIDEYWEKARKLGNPQRCTRYVKEYLFKEVTQRVVLAMDEVDIIFDTDYRSDFFGMLRSWHSGRAVPGDDVWKRLDLVLVTSTEPSFFIKNLLQSPFNVGEVIALEDFTRDQVSELNRRCNSPLSGNQLENLTALLGGHPYLTTKAFSLISNKRISVKELFVSAASDSGPFAEDLSNLLLRLQRRKELMASFIQVIRHNTCAEEECYLRLSGAGLVRREGRAVVPRCQIYAEYFKERLHVSRN